MAAAPIEWPIAAWNGPQVAATARRARTMSGSAVCRPSLSPCPGRSSQTTRNPGRAMAARNRSVGRQCLPSHAPAAPPVRFPAPLARRPDGRLRKDRQPLCGCNCQVAPCVARRCREQPFRLSLRTLGMQSGKTVEVGAHRKPGGGAYKSNDRAKLVRGMARAVMGLSLGFRLPAGRWIEVVRKRLPHDGRRLVAEATGRCGNRRK